MQLVVFALLGCCVVAHSASLSDTFAVGKSAGDKSTLDSVESGIELSVEDPKREKRSGSGGFLAGIGSAILGKVAQASSGLSSGSSDGRAEHQYESVEYGPPVHTYDDKKFDIWSFKKAILNTLFQALKAIGGGVIALKGKLIKGGGIVISAKGNIISAKGEAISTLGRQIAASAILTPPKTSQEYHHYEAPVHVPASGHDAYGGPPPALYNQHGGYASASSHSYGHSGYASPSDDADHPGLLIVKPLSQENNEHTSYHGNFGGDSTDDSQESSIAALTQSFGGSQKISGLEKFIGKFAGASNSNSEDFGKGGASSSVEANPGLSHTVEHVEHKGHEPGQNYGPQIFNNGDDHGHRGTHVIQNLENSDIDGDKLGPLIPLGYPQGNVNPNYHQYENQNLGFGDQLSHSDYTGLGNSHLIFSMPLELPILQPRDQPTYFSPHNQLQDFNVVRNPYGGAVKRNAVSNIQSKVRILPAVGYPLKGSRIYRI